MRSPELVKRHQSAVRACLRKLTAGNHALADDLAQDTFVLAWRNLKSFRQEARFSTWLYRIATNCWLARRAQAARKSCWAIATTTWPTTTPTRPMPRIRCACRSRARSSTMQDRPRTRRWRVLSGRGAGGDRPVLP